MIAGTSGLRVLSVAQQRKSVQPRHPVIQDHASRPVQVRIGQQRRPAAVHMDAKPLQPKCKLQRITHRLIVIDDDDEFPSVSHP